MLYILAQRERVNVRLAISCVVKFDLRNLWLKLAISEKVEIVSLRIPGGTVSIKHVVGDFAHLAVRGVPNTNRREAIGVIVVTESQIISTRRPGVIANLTVRSIRNLNQLAIGERDDVELSILI